MGESEQSEFDELGESEQYEFDKFCLKIRRAANGHEEIQLYCEGIPQILSQNEAKTLQLLIKLAIEKERDFFETKALAKEVCGKDDENVIHKAVRGLKRIFNDPTKGGKYLENVPKKGYRFIMKVRQVGDIDFGKKVSVQVDVEPEIVKPNDVKLSAEAEDNKAHSAHEILEVSSVSNNGMEEFKAWRWGPGKIITSILAACILLTIIFSVVGSYSGWEWTNLCVSGAQAIVLLIAIIYPQRGPKGFRPVDKNDALLLEDIRESTGYDNWNDWGHASDFAGRSLARYTNYWRGILFTWLLLYVFLTALSHPALNLNCPPESSHYCVENLNDLGSIVKRLKSDKPDDISLYLHEHFSSETNEILNSDDGSPSRSEAVKRALVRELNSLLKDPYLPRLASIFGDEFRGTIEQKRKSEGLASTNRSLLDKFYPNNLQNITTHDWGYGLSLLTTLLNNFSSLMIILCFNVLNKPTETKNGEPNINDTSREERNERKQTLETKNGELNINDTYFSIGAALVVVLTMIEIIIAPPGTIERYYVLSWWSWGSGIIGGIAMALYVGRLQSKFLGPPAWLIIALYSYTAIQSLFVFLEESQLAAVILIDAALVLKCLLFLYMAWLFQSGRLLFYLVRVRRTYKGVKTEWPVFRKILKHEK